MSGRLITDLDVLTGRVGSPIVLGPGDLLTPAARDRAIATGMVVVDRDGSTSGGVAPASPSVAGTPGSSGWRVGVEPAVPVAAPSATDVPSTCGCRGGAGCACARCAGKGAPGAACGGSDRAGTSRSASACGCGGSGVGAGCSCARCAGAATAAALGDGLHLVRVEGGRVVWTRPLAGEAPARPPG